MCRYGTYAGFFFESVIIRTGIMLYVWILLDIEGLGVGNRLPFITGIAPVRIKGLVVSGYTKREPILYIEDSPRPVPTD